MKKNSKTADLLKVLGGKITSGQKPPAPKAPLAPHAPPHPTPKARLQKRATPKATPLLERAAARGADIHMWLHAEDLNLIQELAVWLLSQRKRINSSLVVKTVLRAAKTGPELLAAYDEAVKVDARLPRKKPRSEAP
jgi:hypothetical protein